MMRKNYLQKAMIKRRSTFVPRISRHAKVQTADQMLSETGNKAVLTKNREFLFARQ